MMDIGILLTMSLIRATIAKIFVHLGAGSMNFLLRPIP